MIETALALRDAVRAAQGLLAEWRALPEEQRVQVRSQADGLQESIRGLSSGLADTAATAISSRWRERSASREIREVEKENREIEEQECRWERQPVALEKSPEQALVEVFIEHGEDGLTAVEVAARYEDGDRQHLLPLRSLRDVGVIGSSKSLLGSTRFLLPHPSPGSSRLAEELRDVIERSGQAVRLDELRQKFANLDDEVWAAALAELLRQGSVALESGPVCLPSASRRQEAMRQLAERRTELEAREVPDGGGGDREDSRATASTVERFKEVVEKTNILRDSMQGLELGKGDAVPDGGEGPDPGARVSLLRELGELREAGVLTEDEFQREKGRILGG